MPKNSISPELANVFNVTGNGIVGNGPLPLGPWWTGWNIREETLFHQQALAATNTTMTFFTAAPSDYVSNWPQPGFLTGESAMWATTLAFTIKQGYQPDGTAEVDGEPFQTDTDPSLVIGDMNAIINFAKVEMWIGPMKVIDRIGLHHFPTGGGVEVNMALSNTTATTINHLAVARNGQAHKSNRFQFATPRDIYPNDQCKLTVRWPFARTLKDTYTICAELGGVMVSK